MTMNELVASVENNNPHWTTEQVYYFIASSLFRNADANYVEMIAKA